MIAKILRGLKNFTARLIIIFGETLLHIGYKIRTYRYQAYQPLPWIGKVSKKRDESSHERWRLVENELNIMSSEITRSLKDVGGNLGYFAFKAAERGIVALCFDIQKENVEYGQYVQRKASFSNVGFIKLDLTPLTAKAMPKTDITIFFSVWHHLIVKNNIESARNILSNLWKSTENAMFFESGEDSEISALGITGETSLWVENQLKSICKGGTVKKLGYTDMGLHKIKKKSRTLFMVYRKI